MAKDVEINFHKEFAVLLFETYYKKKVTMTGKQRKIHNNWQNNSTKH